MLYTQQAWEYLYLVLFKHLYLQILKLLVHNDLYDLLYDLLFSTIPELKLSSCLVVQVATFVEGKSNSKADDVVNHYYLYTKWL